MYFLKIKVELKHKKIKNKLNSIFQKTHNLNKNIFTHYSKRLNFVVAQNNKMEKNISLLSHKMGTKSHNESVSLISFFIVCRTDDSPDLAVSNFTVNKYG